MQYPLGSHAADLAELRLVQALLAKAESSLAAATALLRDAEGGTSETEWWIRRRAFLANQPAAPDYATAAQSSSELMARAHAAPLPGWDNIERRTAAPARTVERLAPRHIPEDQLVPAEAAPPAEWVGMSDAELSMPTPWAAIRRAIGVVGGPPADAVQDCSAAPARTEACVHNLVKRCATCEEYERKLSAPSPQCEVCGVSRGLTDGQHSAPPRTEAEKAVLERVKRIVADTTIVHDRGLRLTLCQELHVALDDRYGYHAKAQADRAVLDAMALVPEDTLRRSVSSTLHDSIHGRDPARAELARRGLKP